MAFSKHKLRRQCEEDFFLFSDTSTCLEDAAMFSYKKWLQTKPRPSDYDLYIINATDSVYPYCQLLFTALTVCLRIQIRVTAFISHFFSKQDKAQTSLLPIVESS